MICFNFNDFHEVTFLNILAKWSYIVKSFKSKKKKKNKAKNNSYSKVIEELPYHLS